MNSGGSFEFHSLLYLQQLDIVKPAQLVRKLPTFLIAQIKKLYINQGAAAEPSAGQGYNLSISSSFRPVAFLMMALSISSSLMALALGLKVKG